ncbi:MAG: helix-turn-helix domain-containing protein [Proteobacteria bacterium]|nr:helix-turn-helix domain-containing protein [Pseudomonadota bacterium]
MEALRKFTFEPDYAIPPGQTLMEIMESLDMTQKELAIRTGITVQSLNRIFKGEQPISYETASRLELATGVPARLWNNLETKYREQLAKFAEQQRLQSDLHWLETIPTLELIKRGAIEPQKDKALLLRETLRFYGVSSVAAWKKYWETPAVAARRSGCFTSCPGPASAWIRLGEIQAHSIECQPYDQNKFKRSVQDVRKLTVDKPKAFIPEMRRICADSGVALALVPEMKKVPWSGATRWLSPSKAMILLNLRGKTEDLFWFAFFHEAGHVLNDGKKDLLINDNTEDDPRERKANEYAAEILIPRSWDSKICSITSKRAVIQIASQLGISPGVVVGRYQHLTKKWHFFNELKQKFQWAEN